jgi:serine/threonine protein kinase
MPFDPPLTINEVQSRFLGRYDIDASIQAGGQGAVFRAHLADARVVALKVYDPDQHEERLQREIDALKTIRGPTLVELLDSGRCAIRGKDCRFMVTTFIEGYSLENLLTSQGTQSLERIACIGRDIALALEQIWSKRIVHRDVKPNNIMLTSAGRAVLIDLGIARHIDLHSLTTHGSVWGTYGYFSPEQFAGRPLTCKSDIFALGIVLQQCILGRHPTGGNQGHLAQGGPRTAGLAQGLPASMTELVDVMVHKHAVRRPPPSRVLSEFQAIASSFGRNVP